MGMAVPRLVEDFRSKTLQPLHPDAAVAHAVDVVDEHLLPPLPVRGHDQLVLLGAVIHHDGGAQPRSILRVYECVFEMHLAGVKTTEAREGVLRRVVDATFVVHTQQ